jgi:hypothetical protein
MTADIEVLVITQPEVLVEAGSGGVDVITEVSDVEVIEVAKAGPQGPPGSVDSTLVSSLNTRVGARSPPSLPWTLPPALRWGASTRE